MICLDIDSAVNERAPLERSEELRLITERYAVADQRDDAEAVLARCSGKSG